MVFRTMCKDKQWTFLDKEELAEVLPTINDIEPLYTFNNDNTVIQSCNLDFYGKNIRLLRLSQTSWRPDEDALWYVDMGDGYLINLDGDVSAVHEANASSGFKIKEDVLRDYLKFRLFFEIRNNSRTLIVDDVEILEIKQEKNVERISPYIQPVSVEYNDDDTMTAQAIIHHKDQLYAAKYSISEQGVVKEEKRAPLPLTVKLSNTPKFSL